MLIEEIRASIDYLSRGSLSHLIAIKLLSGRSFRSYYRHLFFTFHVLPLCESFELRT